MSLEHLWGQKAEKGTVMEIYHGGTILKWFPLANSAMS